MLSSHINEADTLGYKEILFKVVVKVNQSHSLTHPHVKGHLKVGETNVLGEGVRGDVAMKSFNFKKYVSEISLPPPFREQNCVLKQ